MNSSTAEDRPGATGGASQQQITLPGHVHLLDTVLKLHPDHMEAFASGVKTHWITAGTWVVSDPSMLAVQIYDPVRADVIAKAKSVRVKSISYVPFGELNDIHAQGALLGNSGEELREILQRHHSRRSPEHRRRLDLPEAMEFDTILTVIEVEHLPS